MFEGKSLQDRIWYRSLFFLISAVSCVLFIIYSGYTLDLKVNNSEYTSLFLTFSVLIFLNIFGCMYVGYKIPII
jgi:Kef-type K+ transport system membrane component KefB